MMRGLLAQRLAPLRDAHAIGKLTAAGHNNHVAYLVCSQLAQQLRRRVGARQAAADLDDADRPPHEHELRARRAPANAGPHTSTTLACSAATPANTAKST